MSDCLFCDMEDVPDEVVLHEGENFRTILDPYPVSYGHTLLVSRRHVESPEDLKDDEWLDLRKGLEGAKSVTDQYEIDEIYRQRLERPLDERSAELVSEALESEYENPDAFNIGVNDGKAAGRTIDHLHIQVIPRYEGDIENPRGGVRNMPPFEHKGDYTK